MPGIDIVDLKDPHFAKRDERAMSLIRSPQDVVPDHMLAFWLLWSAKEALFKYRREAIDFQPKKIPVKVHWSKQEVSFESKGILGRYELTDNYVLAVTGTEKEITHQVFDASHPLWDEGIRTMFTHFLKEQKSTYHLASDRLNLPIINPGERAISFSHHGRFAAVAFPKSIY